MSYTDTVTEQKRSVVCVYLQKYGEKKQEEEEGRKKKEEEKKDVGNGKQ
jgi:hypothetical protein